MGVVKRWWKRSAWKQAFKGPRLLAQSSMMHLPLSKKKKNTEKKIVVNEGSVIKDLC